MITAVIALVAFFCGGGVSAWAWTEDHRRVKRERDRARDALSWVYDHCDYATVRHVREAASAGLRGSSLPEYLRCGPSDSQRAEYERQWREFRVVDLGAVREMKKGAKGR
jgi:formylglycine-generating enzyme required for sulfatase activity